MLSVNEKEHMFELKYRPTTIEECILPKHDKDNFLALVEKGKIPHLILQSNSPGTGKTTVAMSICNDIDAEFIFVNGSGCGIDFIKNDLTRFASSKSLENKQKVIILDEFDRPQLAEAQRYLKTFMEAYGNNCSIIITANNLDNIIKPLQSRASVIQFGSPTKADTVSMMKQMILRCMEICKTEGVEVSEPKVIASLVKKNFPDFRKTINQLDHYSNKGVIDSGILSIVTDERGSIDDVITALKAKDIGKLRTLSTKYAPDYSVFIDKLIDELYTKLSKPSVIRMYEIIGENNQLQGFAANTEVHIMYLFIQLVQEMKWN